MYNESDAGRENSDTVDLKTGKVCGAPRTGRSSSGPGPCQNPAGYRTSHPGYGHCIFHLGESRSHRVAAAKQRVAGEMATLGYPIEVDPGVALLQEVHRTAGHVAWLGEQVRDAPLSTERSAQIIVLYQRERDHLVRSCKMALDVGIAEREVRFAQEQGQQIAAVLSAALVALRLTGAELDRARAVVAEQLRSYTANVCAATSLPIGSGRVPPGLDGQN